LAAAIRATAKLVALLGGNSGEMPPAVSMPPPIQLRPPLAGGCLLSSGRPVPNTRTRNRVVSSGHVPRCAPHPIALR
jgi:hypothetical protein